MPSALKLPGLMRIHKAYHDTLLCREYGTWPSMQLATGTISFAGCVLRHARA